MSSSVPDLGVTARVPSSQIWLPILGKPISQSQIDSGTQKRGAVLNMGRFERLQGLYGPLLTVATLSHPHPLSLSLSPLSMAYRGQSCWDTGCDPKPGNTCLYCL